MVTTKGTSKDSLRSSVETYGILVDQVIQFSGGNKKTFRKVRSGTISQSEFTRFELDNGVVVYINTKNVDWFEIHPRT